MQKSWRTQLLELKNFRKNKPKHPDDIRGFDEYKAFVLAEEAKRPLDSQLPTQNINTYTRVHIHACDCRYCDLPKI